MKKFILIWLPLLTGLVLVAMAAFDLYQFKLDIIDARTMLRREMPVVLLGVLSSLVVFLSAFYWLYKKQWLTAVQSLASPFMFLVCFNIGGSMGAAYLYAT